VERGGKGRAPKLLLNQGPSEPCYATALSSNPGFRFKNAKVGFLGFKFWIEVITLKNVKKVLAVN